MLHSSKIAMFSRFAALCRHFGAVIVEFAQFIFLLFFYFFCTLWGAIIKGAFLLSAGGHYEEPWDASCPFRKMIRPSWFFHITVKINFSSTINMQLKGSTKRMPFRGLLLPFYELMKLWVPSKQWFKWT